MDDERRTKIAAAWKQALANGDSEILWKTGRLQTVLPDDDPQPYITLQSLNEIDIKVEAVTFYLAPQLGQMRYRNVPVMCEGEEFGRIN